MIAWLAGGVVNTQLHDWLDKQQEGADCYLQCHIRANIQRFAEILNYIIPL